VNPVLLLGGLALAGALLPAQASGAESSPPAKKLYWFIPDGTRADPKVFDVFRFAREGRYPNIKKMMEQGSYGYTIPTYPSHTPTNFATLMTGAYPERHGVADGPMHIEGYPLEKPSLMGFRSSAKKLKPVWSLFEEAGKKVAVVSVPGSTPPELQEGITLRGRWGKWGSDFFAVNFESLTDAKQRYREGRGVRLFYLGEELTKFAPVAPAAGWTGAPRSYSPPLEMALEGYGAAVFAYLFDTTDDGKTNYSAVRLSLDKKTLLEDLRTPGAWTAWKPVPLKWGDIAIAGSLKACLIKLDPAGTAKFRVYYDLLNRTTVQPPELADAIHEAVGPMVDFVDNWPAQLDRVIEEKAVFFSEAMMSLDWHRRIVRYLYEKQRPDVLIHDVYTPNQMLESRWWLRYLDPDSPDYGSVGEDERARLWEEMHALYKGLDDILGEAMARAGSDSLIVFTSDHGVIPIKRLVLPNDLFAREGLLKFRMDAKTGEPIVDWANTQAIHLKMHGIYLRPDGLAGNWKRGSGPEYEALRRKVRSLLLGLEYEGEKVFRDVLPWEEAAKLREPADRVGDLLLVMRPGFHLTEEMSEDLALFRAPVGSGYKQALVADDIPGMWAPFVIMGPGVKKGFRIPDPIHNADQAPTLFRLMGLAVPDTMQGRVVAEIIAP